MSSALASRRELGLRLERGAAALKCLGRSRRGRLGVSLGVAIVTTAILALAGRSLLDSGQPLATGNPAIVAV
jgi:hypothetical protein